MASIKDSKLEYRLSFPEPDLVQVNSISYLAKKHHFYFKKDDYICAEKYLHGDYVKWTNNFGYKNPNM